jgi:hypothetical protein
MRKKSIITISGIIVILTVSAFVFLWPVSSGKITPHEPIGDDEEEMLKRRSNYFELIHRAAPGTDWRAIEASNREMLLNIQQQRLLSPNRVMESFAGGYLTGTWTERGSNNVAGNVKAVDYVPASNTLYLVSDGGTLWQGNPDAGNWTVLNQTKRLRSDVIEVFPNGSGGQRIMVAENEAVWYSDNNGASFTQSTGISFPVGWGGNYVSTIITLNDAGNTVYCLTRPWDPAPWAPRYWLYRSTNRGASFTQIYTFGFGDDGFLSLYSPFNSTELYGLSLQSGTAQSTLYTISAATVSVLSNNTNLPVNVPCVLKGFKNGVTVNFYTLTNNNQVYKSITNGATWTLQSNLPENSWGRLAVSLSDENRVSFGGVQAYRSSSGGVSWTLVNGWGDYYENESTKLHADIMEIAYFRKTDNTEFAVINTHGGMYISYDHLINNTNVSLTSLNTGQFYDVITDPFNTENVYGGSQDQGAQRASNAISQPGTLNFVQFFSGDYGHMQTTGNPSKLWIQYVGGDVFFYGNPSAITGWTGPDAGLTVGGTEKPNYGWMLPTATTSNILKNEILIGGGNMTGGTGSYLIKFNATLAPYTITDSQYSYNFRANSNSTASGISAIEIPLNNPGKMYVATEDGTFFYSNNSGSSWTKTTSFDGPDGFWLYGSCILASTISPNTVWFAGSGYSNPGVYKSIDGGVTFSAMNNGLPNTMVHEIAANPGEGLIFAATEAGPYVYVAQNNQWYSLMGASTPLQDYFTVEYIPSQKIARFGTYGRGIWDFKIQSILPVSLTDFTATKTASRKVDLRWITASEVNSSHFIVQRSADGINFSDIGRVTAAGNNSVSRTYNLTDQRPLPHTNFYRLSMVDIDTRSKYSQVLRVEMGIEGIVNVYPNPFGEMITVSGLKTGITSRLRITDMSGKVVYDRQSAAASVQVNLAYLPAGIYSVEISDGKKVIYRKISK